MFKDALKKAAGLFVELPEETPAGPAVMSEPLPDLPAKPVKTVEEIVQSSPGPNLDEIKVEPKTIAPAAPGGKIDFLAIYQQAGVPESPFGAEKALEMITALPPELPLDAKRQTVRVTMEAMGRAMGVTPESVVTDASRKLAALDSYGDALNQRTAEFVAATQLEIADLERQIAEKRRLIDETKGMLQSVLDTCKGEVDRLDDVLEFFSLDQGPSKLA